ncbi:MAG: 16S rRNA (guanine(527)-N(7))-methyltransferase RsmG [Chloroflexi bacterium]|nr:16S rRNA (guanine(527)-N(7))-methyltransferase RsmG [Chloroflexota bacterium]
MEELRVWASDLLNLEFNDEQLNAFQRFSGLLVEWNEKINLTAIKEKKEIFIKHFLDSLTCLKILPRSGDYSLIDLGTGAGFPGIPLMIINPAIHLTLADSVRKKVDFCHTVVKELGLTGVQIIHTRAEDLGQEKETRERFDWTVARAVADLPILAEYMLPLTKVGGHALVMKGAEIHEEIQRSESALITLGGKISSVEYVSLPENSGERSLVLIEKVKRTPAAYPRKAGTPAKKPLS